MNKLMNWFSRTHKNEPDNEPDEDTECLSEYFKFFRAFYVMEESAKMLGEGSFGTVFQVKNSVDDGEFALKIIRIEGGERNTAREIKCLRELDHPNILRYYFAFKIDKLPTKWRRPKDFPSITPLFCIQTELCNTNLREKLYEKGNQPDKMLKKEFKRFASQICDAVKYFHDCNIMHRDMNPNNIFLKKDVYGTLNVKIGDFGLGRFNNTKEEPITIEQIGNRYYRCIEMNDAEVYTMKCDVYSLGVILYEMFHPKLLVPPSPEPIHASMNALRSVYTKDKSTQVLPDDDASFTPEMKNLIIGMLQKENQRPTAVIVNSLLNEILPTM